MNAPLALAIAVTSREQADTAILADPSDKQADHFFASFSNPAAMALLMASYGKQAKEESHNSKIVATSSKKAGKKPAKLAKPKEEKPDEMAPVIDPYCPIKGTITAGDFLIACRRAGMVEVTSEETGEVRMVLDPVAKRWHERQAVSGFVGLTGEPHGTQLDRAQLEADRLLRGGTAIGAGSGDIADIRHFVRNPASFAAAHSVEGFVSGLPNGIKKLLGDLYARERIAVEQVALFESLRQMLLVNDLLGYEERLCAEFPVGHKAEEVFSEEGQVIGYRKVEVRDIVHTALLAVNGEDRFNLLDDLLAIADSLLDCIQEDINSLDGNAFSASQIAKVHSLLIGRAVPSLESCFLLLAAAREHAPTSWDAVETQALAAG